MTNMQFSHTRRNVIPQSARGAGGLVLCAPFFVLAQLALASSSLAHQNEVTIAVADAKRCISSNGLPDHDTGQFPNSGNPNTISAQNIQLCVPAEPAKGNRARPVRGSIGVAVNGVQFRPGTADYFDPESPRGFSRDRSSGWNLEGLGARETLGMDQNNAHVDQRGLYHYHGVAPMLARSAGSSLIGYAADGFEIHYAGTAQSSSYRLKSGERAGGPGGAHDGTYNEDWRYAAGSGSLDECNGGLLNGNFVYFATDAYPFFPRCLWGEISSDFQPAAGRKGPRRARHGDDGERKGRRARNSGDRRGPPQAAIAACQERTKGDRCTFSAPGQGRSVSGTCRMTPDEFTACVPQRPRG